MVVIKKHWLHGDIKFNVDVATEDSCIDCDHWQVCKRDMPNFCLNYCFGTSEHNGKPLSCNTCLHRYTRFNEDKIVHGTPDRIPCFKCRWFSDTLHSTNKEKQ